MDGPGMASSTTTDPGELAGTTTDPGELAGTPAGGREAQPIEIEVARQADPALVQAIARLLPQLSPVQAPTEARVDEVVSRPGNSLVVARHGDTVVGALTVVVVELLTGTRALIEDVVVDEAFRGRGVGADLVTRALEIAEERGARTVELTSRPSREAANRLYARAGFARRETNVWRWSAQSSSRESSGT